MLDLGGVHSALVGKIDFSTGIVTYPDPVDGRAVTKTMRQIFEENYRARNPSATEEAVAARLNRIFKDGGSVFRDYSSHTMKMYYMERGAGASNLHMRFNLTTAANGQLLVGKTVSGTDKDEYADYKFGYQIYYYDTVFSDWRTVDRVTCAEAEGDTYVYADGNVSFVHYEGTQTPVEYAAAYNGRANVFFLKPGEMMSVQFPDDQMQYYVKEVGVETNVFDRVTANDEALTGVGNSDIQDFATDPEVIGDRKMLYFENHVSASALRTLSIKKYLYDESHERRISYTDDNTGFRFRVYIGAGTDSEGLGYYRMDSYYVRNAAGYYCRYDADAQAFVSAGVSDFSQLSGDLLLDTPYKIEEHESDIPKGYEFIRYMRGDSGGYAASVNGETNAGVIRAGQDPVVIVENEGGWGLTVNKVWSDDSFMQSHDNIYFAVYCDGDLLPGTVRRMQTEVTAENPTAETELYYYFKNLQENKSFGDYAVREVVLTDPVVDENGVVTGYSSISPIAEGGSLTNGGVPARPADGGEEATVRSRIMEVLARIRQTVLRLIDLFKLLLAAFGVTFA